MGDMTQSLSGAVALITGAGLRLGKAMAEALAAHGADVVVHYFRSATNAAETVAAIEQLGRRGWTVQGFAAPCGR